MLFYADYDEDTGLWCVFFDDEPFAYSSWATKAQAEEDADKRNKE